MTGVLVGSPGGCFAGLSDPYGGGVGVAEGFGWVGDVLGLSVGDAAGGPGGNGGVEDVVDAGAAGWAEVVGQGDAGGRQEAASAGSACPTVFGVGQRCAGQGGEADLGVDLDDPARGGRDPLVNLQKLGAQAVGLCGDAGAGPVLVDR